MTAPATSPDSTTVSGQVNPYGSGQISIWGGPGFRTVRTTKPGETGIIGARRVDHENATDYGFGAAGIQYFLTDPDGMLIPDVAGLMPVDVLGNDIAGGTAADDRINSSTLAVSSAATHGLGISYQAQIWYAPHIDYVGADSLSYTIQNDGAQVSAAAVVTIDVQSGVSQQPQPLALTIQRDSFITIDAGQAFTTDESLTIQMLEVAAPPAHGMAEVNGTAVTYTPVAGFTGADSFSWRMLINGSWSSSAPVAITVSQPGIVPSYNAPGTQIIHPTEGVSYGPLPVAYATPDAANTLYNTPVVLSLLENDLPLGGVTLQGFTQPAHGTVVANGSDGTVIYTPQPGYTGPDTFNYTMTDGITACSAPVTLMVLSPLLVATQNFAATVGAEPVVINVLGNDLGTGLSLTAVSNPPHGTAIILGGNARVQYQADLGFVGDEVFFYTSTDSAGRTANGMLTVTVLAPPLQVDAPSAVTTVGTPVVLPVLDNAVGSGLVVTGVTQPISGLASVAISGGGTTATYLPSPVMAGEDSFEVTVADDYGQSFAMLATVMVAATPMSIVGVKAATQGGTAVVINPLAHNVGDGMRVTAAGPAGHGSAAITDGGATVTYTPQAGYLGLDTFPYTVTDASSQTGNGTIEVTVRMPAISIVGNPWSVITTTPAVIPVLDNDVGVGLEVISVSDPPHGTASISGVATAVAMPTVITQGNNRLAVCFTAVADDVEIGTASGQTGGTWIEQTQRLSAAGDDSATSMQTAIMATGGTISGGTSSLASLAPWVTRALALKPKVAGTTPTLNAAGSSQAAQNSPIIPTYPAVIAGDLLLLHVAVRATNGAVVTPTGWTLLWGPNDASGKIIRSFVYGRIATGTETGQLAVAFTGTSSGIQAQGTIYGFRGAVNTLTFEGEAITSGGGGPTVTYQADGSYTGADSFTYTAMDDFGQLGSATVTVDVLASAPPVKAIDDNVAATAGVLKVITPLVNDRPSNQTIVSVTNPTPHGTAQKSADSKSINYTPAVGFSGNDVFDYTMTNGIGGNDAGTITVTVTLPQVIAVDDEVTALAGVVKNLPVLTNDVGGANLTITTVGTPSNGGGASPTGDGKQIAYTPIRAGLETFTYIVSDGATPPHTSTATVRANVTEGDGGSGVLATPNSYTATAGVPRPLTPLVDDLPATGTLFISGANQDHASSATITIIDGPRGPNSQLNYTAQSTFSGPDVFDYTISDGAGGTSTAEITVTVTQATFAPQDDPQSTPANTAVTFSPLGNDGGTNPVIYAIGSTTDFAKSCIVRNTDPVPVVARNDGPGAGWIATVLVPTTLDVLANDSPADGTLIVKSGSITNFSRGGSGTRTGDFKKIVYTPPATAGDETFTYIATNNTTDSSPATVTIAVGPNWPTVQANRDPTTGSIACDTNVRKTIDVLANDTPTTGITITVVTQGAHGFVDIASNQVRYRSDVGYVGPDTFNYTIADAAVPPHTSTAAVAVQVSAVIVPIVVRDDSGTGFEPFTAEATLLSPLGNDSGGSAPLTIVLSSLTTPHGTVALATGNTQVNYKSAANYTGADSFKYRATDGISTSTEATVTLNVKAKPPADDPWVTITPVIGLSTSGGRTVMRPTAAQLKNILPDNADADHGGGTPNVTANNVTIDLRDRKFFHHSLTAGPNSTATPGRKSPIRPAIRNGLCIYGAEVFGEQLPVGSTQYNNANYFSMKNKSLRTGGTNTKTMDDNGLGFEGPAVNNAELLVEHCIFRGQFDGISCDGNGTATNQIVRVRECYAEEQVDEFLEMDSLQRLTVEGVLVDSCGHFLSMRPGSGSYPDIPDYSPTANNRIKLRQCLVRLRGTFYTSNNGPNPYGDAFKPYAKRDRRWDIDDPTASFNWLPDNNDTRGFTHGQWFKGNGDNQLDYTPYAKPPGGWNSNNANLYDTMTSMVVDCEYCIFAFENQRNTSTTLYLPPGTYKNTVVCFLPDMDAGGPHPNQSDFVDANLITNRTGVTVKWGQEARDFWTLHRDNWIAKRNGFTNTTTGLLDFPFAHM